MLSPVAGMVWLGPGSFVMGSPESDPDSTPAERPQTRVYLTRGFFMQEHEVTMEEYASVMGDIPGISINSDNASFPVEKILWNEAVQYCQALSEREQAAGRLPAGYAYRLPTEAEWEYACRAGTTTRYSFGDDMGYSAIVTNDWCNNSSYYHPNSVGKKIPNPWGLYDMHGNVMEWCSDYWKEGHPGGEVTDPKGPLSGSNKVVKGGGYHSWPKYARSAYRTSASPGARQGALGFRVVLAPLGP
jgi:formylglycine-generating enzyme required for sulfatase activity